MSSSWESLGQPIHSKGDQPIHSKGDQSWVFFGRTDAKAETPILWPPHAKSWLIGKDSDAGRDLGQEEKGTTEDEMAGWHHWLDGQEFEWTPGVGDGQGGLACCSSWGHKDSDTTERLNWIEPFEKYYSRPKKKKFLLYWDRLHYPRAHYSNILSYCPEIPVIANTICVAKCLTSRQFFSSKILWIEKYV